MKSLTALKLKSPKLADVTLVPIETRSTRKMFRVDVHRGIQPHEQGTGFRGTFQAGIIEKFKDDQFTTNPWKASRGIGFWNRYVKSFYADEGGLEAAVACVLERTL